MYMSCVCICEHTYEFVIIYKHRRIDAINGTIQNASQMWCDVVIQWRHTDTMQLVNNNNMMDCCSSSGGRSWAVAVQWCRHHTHQQNSFSPASRPAAPVGSRVCRRRDRLYTSTGPPTERHTCNWRSLDVDALMSDLSSSELVQSPPDDVDDAFACYNSTLRSLLDKHAPLQTRWVSRRSTARWYDDECREAKRKTIKLERQYRCLNTSVARTASCNHYQSQRRLFEAKYTSFSCSTIDSCRNNPRALWRAIRQLTEPPQQSPTAKLTAHDFAIFLR